MESNKYDNLIGGRLVENIFDAGGTLLVAKGTELLETHLKKLEKFRIDIDDIKIEGVTAEESANDPAESAASGSISAAVHGISLQDMVRRAEERLREIDSFVHQNGTVPLATVEEYVLPVIKEATHRHNLFQLLNELKEHGDYRYKQSIGTAVIATSLGRRLHLPEAELTLLTTAAILYDIGSLKLPSFLANKPLKLDVHETAIMKQHTVLGYELLQQSGVDERVALVALQHHEREDGSGYPSGLKGNQIDRLSKIVALADVYMAMISERPYRPAVAFFEVMNDIHQQIVQQQFDLAIGLTFLDSLLSAQIGCDVILSDERRGKIMLTNVNYPTKPLIALPDDAFIDLSKTSTIAIREIVG